MRFISKDCDKQADIKDLLYTTELSSDSITEDGNTMTLFSSNYISGQGSQYSYGTPETKKYYQIKSMDITSKLISTFQTWCGLTITTNLSSTAQAYLYNFFTDKISNIKTSMWITIFTNKGLYFVLPERMITSKLISEYKIMGIEKNELSNFSFENDNTGDFVVNLIKDDTVLYSTINSTLKRQILNIYKALNDKIYIQINKAVNPMDYVIYNGNNYLIVSQKRDKGQMLYLAIKEVIDNYTFTGANIYPFYIDYNGTRLAYYDNLTTPIRQQLIPAAFGGMHDIIGTTKITCTIAGTYYGITSMVTNTRMRLITFTDNAISDRLTILSGGDGDYKITLTAVVIPNAASNIKMALYKNNTIITGTDYEIYQPTAWAGILIVLEPEILALNYNDYIDVRIANNVAGTDVYILRLHLNMVRVNRD